MQIRDRVRELRRVKAGLLRPHPRNWRTHPDAQRDALRGVLAEVGFAGALLARELPDGSLELIDGHLRAETTPDMELPVLVLDLNEEEAQKLLAVHDPLAAMATVDVPTLSALVDQVETQNAAVRQLLEDLIRDAPPGPVIPTGDQPLGKELPERFQLLVECDDEAAQRDLYERLTAEGHKCRVLTV